MARSVVKNTDSELASVRNQFEEWADATISSRAVAEKCRDYRDGIQWTEEERNALKKRKQPCITDNKIQDKCDTLLGIEKNMRTDPRAYPRNPGDEQAADAATDALRFIADKSDFNRSVRKPASDNLMVEGLCAGQVIVEKKKGRDPEVCMEHIRWDRVYYDIHSLREDFSDKSYCGYFRWMDYEAAKREFPDNAEALDACFSQQSISGPNKTLDDKPRYIMTQTKRKRVQVFKHYMTKDGVWHEGVWCKGGWLEAMKPCAYKDEHGEPQCCLEIQALYRDSDGNPYGMVQRYIDLQDEHNKRRSKMLHLLNSKRIVAQKGTLGDDLNAVRAEIHKPDGVVEVAGDITQFRVEDNLAEADGQWRLLQQTDLALSQTGPNPALQGISESNSGRAKQIEQQAGALPISPLFDALDGWETRMYRQAWSRVKQYWTSATWVRVTDDEDNVRFVGLNQPVLAGDLHAEQLKNAQMSEEEKLARVQALASDPSMQMPALDDNGQPQVKNKVAEIDVDIVIDRSPDVANLQQEEFQVLSELAKSRPEVPFKALIKASQLRNKVKREITDQLDKTPQIPPEIQQQLEQQQQGLQAAQQELMKKAQEVEQKEQQFKDMESSITVEAASLEVTKAEIKAERAQLDAARAELDAAKVALESQAQSAGVTLKAERTMLGAERSKALSEIQVREAGLAVKEAQSPTNEDRASLEKERQSMTSDAQQAVVAIQSMAEQFMQMTTQMLQQLQASQATPAKAPRVKAIKKIGTEFLPVYED